MLDKSNGDPADFESDVDLTNGEAMHVDPRDGTMSRLTQKFRTLRLPAWINFSYSTIPHRARHAHRRRSNPFGPPGPQRPPFGRLGSLDDAAKGGEASAPPPDAGTVLSTPLQASPIGDMYKFLTTIRTTPEQSVISSGYREILSVFSILMTQSIFVCH
jgi:hypothetical protein